MTPLPDGITHPPSSESLGEDGRTDGSATRGVFDPLAKDIPGPVGEISNVGKIGPQARPKEEKPPRPMVEFWTPSQLRAYEPPPNQSMVGDYHIQRGAIAVLAGPPGCGKSRAALWLAITAEGSGQWLGFDVRCSFRTLILQNENGLARLHRDFEELGVSERLDDWLRISAPPTLGLNITYPQFQAELNAAMRDFAPHLVVVDPWNALARDAMVPGNRSDPFFIEVLPFFDSRCPLANPICPATDTRGFDNSFLDVAELTLAFRPAHKSIFHALGDDNSGHSSSSSHPAAGAQSSLMRSCGRILVWTLPPCDMPSRASCRFVSASDFESPID